MTCSMSRVASMAARTAEKVKRKAEESSSNAAAADSHRKDYFDHLRKVNDVFYDQIRIADQKAAYIFTFMLAFMISSADGRSAFNFRTYAEGDPVLILISATLAVSVVFCISAAILAVLPRVRAESTSLFWGNWRTQRVTFEEAFHADDAEYLFQQYLTNIDNLAYIARSKYRFVGLAFRGLFVALGAYLALLAIA